MSGYEVQDAQGATLFEGDTFMECVEVIRNKELHGTRIVAVLVGSGELL